jgi:hypothetical protein
MKPIMDLNGDVLSYAGSLSDAYHIAYDLLAGRSDFSRDALVIREEMSRFVIEKF